MNSNRLTFSTSLKSTLFCTILIWGLNLLCFTNYNDIHLSSISLMLLALILSAIPIFIVIYLMILLTITPFYIYEINKLSRKEIFKKYFPYYAIAFFGICLFIGIHYSQLFFINFLISAFLTAMQTWVWFFNSKKILVKN